MSSVQTLVLYKRIVLCALQFYTFVVAHAKLPFPRLFLSVSAAALLEIGSMLLISLVKLLRLADEKLGKNREDTGIGNKTEHIFLAMFFTES